MTQPPTGPSANFVTGDLERLQTPIPTDHQRHQAVRTVAALAADAEDCRALLAQLGLDPREGWCA